MAAPTGNNNAGKGREWKDALVYALDNYQGIKKGQALRKIGEKLVEMALDGDIQAIREIGDRLDGKPKQAVVGGDDDDPPLRFGIVELVALGEGASKDT